MTCACHEYGDAVLAPAAQHSTLAEVSPVSHEAVVVLARDTIWTTNRSTEC